MSMKRYESGRTGAGPLFACSALLVSLSLHSGLAAAQRTTTTVTTTECVRDSYGNCVTSTTETTTYSTTTRVGAGWGPASVRGVARRTSRRTARRVSRRH